jgi:hypothetical protein
MRVNALTKEFIWELEKKKEGSNAHILVKIKMKVKSGN